MRLVEKLDWKGLTSSDLDFKRGFNFAIIFSVGAKLKSQIQTSYFSSNKGISHAHSKLWFEPPETRLP
jgi:hypothetical protein